MQCLSSSTDTKKLAGKEDKGRGRIDRNSTWKPGNTKGSPQQQMSVRKNTRMLMNGKGGETIRNEGEIKILAKEH